ncbi:MAG: HAD family phosphatase [Burkholderiales bacterium]|nr:HAD family phosphatase [Burkholderiales bacterium]
MRIVFDFGGVLFRWRPTALLRQVLPERAPDEPAARHWAKQVLNREWLEFDRGVVEPAELADAIAQRTGLAPGEVMAVIDAVPDELAPLADSVDLLERLHAAGSTLHYLSNMPLPYAEHLDREHAFLQRFSSGVYSGRVRMVKPDAEIFELAAEQFGAHPSELVFLDDLGANVEAARAAGWQALPFTDAAQAERDLRQAGWWPTAAA